MISIIIFFVTSADSASIVVGSMSQRGKPNPTPWVTIAWGLLLVIGIMIAWAKDLRTDPYMLPEKYARAAIAQGVRLGITDHGDNFVFGSSEVSSEDGAGAWLDSEYPSLSEGYVDASTTPPSPLDAEDVLQTLDPGQIQPRGPERHDHLASGDTALRGRWKLPWSSEQTSPEDDDADKMGNDDEAPDDGAPPKA